MTTNKKIKNKKNIFEIKFFLASIMAHFIEDAIMHNPKILSYSINLESINLPGYTSEERIKCINNIGKIICQKGPRIVTDFDFTTSTNIFGFISLQETTNADWEVLKQQINLIEPDFLANYNVYQTDSLVTLINSKLYLEKLSITTESLISGLNSPYHLFILGDSSGYTTTNKIIYVNLELPKDKSTHIQAIQALKTIFETLDKTQLGQHRIILSGQFNNSNPESIPGFDNLLDGFDKNVLFTGPEKILTSKQKTNVESKYIESNCYVFENYNKFITWTTLTDLTDFTDTTGKILLGPNLPVFAKLGIINIVEYDLASVEANFSKLVNVEFVISHLANIEPEVVKFKSSISNFKSTYTFLTQDIREKIERMEMQTEKNLEHQRNLQLFSEPYVFSNPIKEYESGVFGTTITDLVVFGSKKSSSNSLILQGKYQGKPVFIKMFSLNDALLKKDNHGLTYEQKIYKYLMERSTTLKPYYEDYFVKVYDVFKVKKIYFFDKLESLKVKIKGGTSNGQIYYNRLNHTILENFSGKDQMVYFTVTEDIQGENYNGFLSKNLGKETIVIETLFDVFYSIYLLNVRLGIIHGDNHFGNILIKPEKKIREYHIDKTTLVRESNYRVCLFDFDLSFMFNYENKALEDPFNAKIGRISRFNYAKDVWTVINNIGYLLNYDPDTINPKWKSWYDNMQNNFVGKVINSEPFVQTYMFDLINNVIFQTQEQKDTLYYYFYAYIKSNSYWNKFCALPATVTSGTSTSPSDTICVQPEFPELHPELVLKRFISFYKDKLNFTDVNAYYRKYFIRNNLSKYANKYLKYKKKYLDLKFKKNL